MHAGLLCIEGDPVRGLKWRPRAKDACKRTLESLESAQSLAQVRVVEVPGFSGCPETETAPATDSADAEKSATIPIVTQALRKLKWRKGEALERARRAWERLSRERPGETIGVSELLKEAART